METEVMATMLALVVTALKTAKRLQASDESALNRAVGASLEQDAMNALEALAENAP